jgi:hypothetical protein
MIKVCAHLHYSICKALGIEMTNDTPTHPNRYVNLKMLTVLWNQGVHTDREVMANRPDTTIKNKNEKTCILIDVAISAARNVTQKEAEKKQIQEFMYRDITNVEHEMHDYSGNNWSHRNSNKRFKEKSGSHTSKTFNRFTTKDSYTWNITHNMESTIV